MILGATSAIQWLTLLFGTGAFIGAGVAIFKAPSERDATKRSISVDEAAEIRETLSITLDQVQEERDGARAEARLLRQEVRECRGDCDAVRSENSELKARNESLQRHLGMAERNIEELNAKVAELQATLEGP